ncbi:hypothetical protein QR680_007062 [Steinernema hermaphroditum]|uniref:Metalloendopeptidase n=1 Tax=Steinernema hermaphroditum TaxID=289476 RepID=A0AA39HZ45_9BILA|nr:hypothetical protein QR680_007062 [Steinernema hermaphroditum]
MGTIFKLITFDHDHKTSFESEPDFYENNKVIVEEVKKLNPKPLPEDAPRSIAEVNNALGLDEILIEGDILMSLEQAKRHFGLAESTNRAKRQAYQPPDYPNNLWFDGVYYIYDPTLNEKAKDAIKRAIAFWKSNTCITFHEVTDPSQAPYDPVLSFFAADGCWSYIGKNEGNRIQRVSIGYGCESIGTAAHEIAHALGFMHEQSRWDRDQFVKIAMGNVKKGQEHNFDKYSKLYNFNYFNQYDFSGIMHYGDKDFAKDRQKPVIYSLKPEYQMSIGGAEIPTYGDIYEMNWLYQCYALGMWRTLTVKNEVGYGPGLVVDHAYPAHCTWHIKAPKGHRIQFFVSYVGMNARRSLCYHQCYFGGVNIKGLEKTWIPEGMRVCCPAQYNKTLTTESNLLVVQPWNVMEYTNFNLHFRIDDSPLPSTTPPPPLPTPTPEPFTSKQIHDMGKYVVSTYEMTFNDAKTFCAMEGNQLRIQPKKTHNYWIGLRKPQGIRSAYEWIDGSSFDYKNWMKGFPKPSPNEQCVVAIGSSGTKWLGINCYLKMDFVCEKIAAE